GHAIRPPALESLLPGRLARGDPFGAQRLGLGPRPRQQRLGLGPGVERHLGDDVPFDDTTHVAYPSASAANANRRRPSGGARRCATACVASRPSGTSATASARAPRCAARSEGLSPATRSTRRRAASRAWAGPVLAAAS